jgi:hypothetical protein
LPAPFTLSDRHKQEIIRIAPELEPIIVQIEAECDRHLHSERPLIVPPIASLEPAPASLIEALRGDEGAFSDIEAKAKAMLDRMASLSDYHSERLGRELAHWQDKATVDAINRMTSREYRASMTEKSSVALARHVEALSHVRDAARAAQPPEIDGRMGRPPAYDKLIVGLHLVIGDAYDVRILPEWQPFAAPKGKFCRLVGVCLEAIDSPSQSNIAQTVRRVLHREAQFWQDLERADDLRLLHNEQKCDPETQWCHLSPRPRPVFGIYHSTNRRVSRQSRQSAACLSKFRCVGNGLAANGRLSL